MKRTVTARKFVRHPGDDDTDPDFWARISPSDRFAETWTLSEEIWRFKGWDPGEPGLSRSTARVIRRRR